MTLQPSLGPGKLHHLPSAGGPQSGLSHSLDDIFSLPVPGPVQTRALLRVLLALPLLLPQDLTLAVPQQLRHELVQPLPQPEPVTSSHCSHSHIHQDDRHLQLCHHIQD